MAHLLDVTIVDPEGVVVLQVAWLAHDPHELCLQGGRVGVPDAVDMALVEPYLYGETSHLPTVLSLRQHFTNIFCTNMPGYW